MTHDIRARVAKALGWTQAEVGQFSLPALHAMVRPVDPKLAADMEKVIAGKEHWTRKGHAKGTSHKARIYATTYCNRGHYVASGKPVGHECITIPPAALKAEMEGDYQKAIEIMQKRRGMAKGTAFTSEKGVHAGAVHADRFYEFDELPKKEQKFFDWAKRGDHRFVRVPYGKGSKRRFEFVAVEEFQHTPGKKSPSGRPADGFASDSYFSGVAIKMIPESSGSEFDYQVWNESW